MIKELHKYVSTEYALCTQWDGFVVNPTMYSDDFLKYDYIGAVWNWNDEASVGNGGFSLRSKKFLEVCSQLPIKNFHPEDEVACRTYRNLLLEKDIRFAPKSLAKRFSFEGNSLVGYTWTGNTWGFHDFQVSDMRSWPGYKKFMEDSTND